MTPGEPIGPIVRMQIQTLPIKKKGEGYLPEYIMEVPSACRRCMGHDRAAG